MSNIVSIINGQSLASTMAIADGVGNSHKTVIQLVRQNIKDLEEFGGVAFENASFKTNGGMQNREYALLNEDQATLLMTYMRNNDVVRAFKKRLVKAFRELRDNAKTGIALIDFNNPQQVAGLLAQSLQVAEQQQRKIEEDKPKVEFHDMVVAAPEALTVAQAAKILGTGRRRLFAIMRSAGWVTRKNEPYQSKIEGGLLDVKLGSWEHPDHGIQQCVTTIVTGKGLVKLRELVSEAPNGEAA